MWPSFENIIMPASRVMFLLLEEPWSTCPVTVKMPPLAPAVVCGGMLAPFAAFIPLKPRSMLCSKTPSSPSHARAASPSDLTCSSAPEPHPSAADSADATTTQDSPLGFKAPTSSEAYEQGSRKILANLTAFSTAKIIKNH